MSSKEENTSRPNDLIRVKRVPKRGIYDRKGIYEILDRYFFCHVAFIHKGRPVSIPTMFGRKGDDIYLHGSAASRMLKTLQEGIDMCVSVAEVQGMVLARSLFHHSLNYESVVIFGKGHLLADEEKEAALKIVSDHMLPGRWEEARLPNDKELKATSVIKVAIDDVSAKVRTGAPGDDDADYDLPIWAGVLPIEKSFGVPITDAAMKFDLDYPKSVQDALGEG